MTFEIPQYGLKAYALLFSRHGTQGAFKQSELDWIVSVSMRKKIFSLLLRAGWITKRTNDEYVCADPSDAIKGLLEFRVPDIMKGAEKPYAFTQLSAVEIWSDFSYVQRGMEKSPYFVKVLQKDVQYWKDFFNKHTIPNYVSDGGTIGEYVILMPVSRLTAEEKSGFKVDSLRVALRYARSNDAYAYAAEYMIRKYGATA